MGWTTLVPPETLAVALQRPDLVIVDCRFSSSSPGAGEFAYEHSHLPGAVYAHLERDLSDMSRRGQGGGRHPWPDAATFTAKLGRWGILPHHQVVAYDDADGSMASRFWFLMRALGHEKVAVLDGGLARWQGMRLPMNSDMVRRRATTYSGTFDASRLLGADQVQERLAAGDLLVDARPADRFRGENDGPRARPRAGRREPALRREHAGRPLQVARATGRGVPRLAGRTIARAGNHDVRIGSYRLPQPAGDGTRRPERRKAVYRFVEWLDRGPIQADSARLMQAPE
jgi:3-mercaptopyruvate sulfurtransferase SseA